MGQSDGSQPDAASAAASIDLAELFHLAADVLPRGLLVADNVIAVLEGRPPLTPV